MDYLTRLQGIVAALADIGENVSDSSLMAKMLGGLLSRFNNLCTVWDSVPSERQLVSDFEERIIKEDTRTEDRRTAEKEEEASALVTISHKPWKKFQKSKNPKEKGKKFSCYYCKEVGHFKKNCPQRDETKTKSGEKKGEDKNVTFVSITEISN